MLTAIRIIVSIFAGIVIFLPLYAPIAMTIYSGCHSKNKQKPCCRAINTMSRGKNHEM